MPYQSWIRMAENMSTLLCINESCRSEVHGCKCPPDFLQEFKLEACRVTVSGNGRSNLALTLTFTLLVFIWQRYICTHIGQSISQVIVSIVLCMGSCFHWNLRSLSLPEPDHRRTSTVNVPFVTSTASGWKTRSPAHRSRNMVARPVWMAQGPGLFATF